MLKLHRLTFYMLLLIKISVSTYNEQERIIILEFCKTLIIKICIFVEDENDKTKFDLSYNLKYFQDEKIFSMVLHYDELINMLEGTIEVHYHELLVLKGSISKLENMIQHFKKVRNGVYHKLRKHV